MQKYLLLLATAALALPARAQTEKGSKLLGVSVGGLNYTSYDNKDRNLNAALTPSVGWFVVDRLAVGTGLTLSYAYSRRNLTAIDAPIIGYAHIWGLGLAPFARYYVVDASKHKLFGYLNGELTRYDQRTRMEEGGRVLSPSKSHYTQKGFAVGAGYNYFVAPSVALEATAGYRRRDQYGYVGMPGRGALDVRLGLSVFLPASGGRTE